MPRLRYADWLEEEGDKQRAAFIRIQCELSACSYHPDSSRLQALTRNLLKAHRHEWVAAECGDAMPVDSVSFRRGFPEHVSLTQKQWEAVAPGLPEWTSVTSAKIKRVTSVERLAASPALLLLRELYLDHNGITDDGAEMLAASPQLTNLTLLSLDDNKLQDRGVRAITCSPHLAGLRTLRLSKNNIDNDGVRAITDSPNMANLTELVLYANRIGDLGATMLAGSPNLRRLSDLDLTCNDIGDAGAMAIASSTNLEGLKHLRLFGNYITMEGATALVTSPRLANLVLLALSNNFIDSASIRLNELTANPDNPLYGMTWNHHGTGTRTFELARETSMRFAGPPAAPEERVTAHDIATEQQQRDSGTER